jgi:hypothetical protein
MDIYCKVTSKHTRELRLPLNHPDLIAYKGELCEKYRIDHLPDWRPTIGETTHVPFLKEEWMGKRIG